MHVFIKLNGVNLLSFQDYDDLLDDDDLDLIEENLGVKMKRVSLQKKNFPTMLLLPIRDRLYFNII